MKLEQETSAYQAEHELVETVQIFTNIHAVLICSMPVYGRDIQF